MYMKVIIISMNLVNTFLDLKNGDINAIIYFNNILSDLMEDEEIAIATVPPHATGESSGVQKLATYLVRDSKNYIDAIRCLERFKTVPKSSQTPGSRNEHTHLDSIRMSDSSLVKDKNVILLDDVITTGSSTNACRKIISKMGAKEVKTVCLGKTIIQVEHAHFLVDEEFKEELQNLDFEHHKKIEEIEMIFDFEMSNIEPDDADRWLEEIYKVESSKRCELDNICGWISYAEIHLGECAEEAHKALDGRRLSNTYQPILKSLCRFRIMPNLALANNNSHYHDSILMCQLKIIARFILKNHCT